MLATGDRSGKIRLQERANAALLRTNDTKEAPIGSLAFGPDEQRWLVTSGKQVHIGEVAYGTVLLALTHEGGDNTQTNIAPDGTMLAVAATESQR